MAAEFDPIPLLVEELALSSQSVRAVVGLLAGGNTVPFIARYRKEATGGLDEVDIRNIAERQTFLQELEDRRRTILASIENQGKLSDALKQKILACRSKTALEDLYLPFRPKRRTRATSAREQGLKPLAAMILEQGDGDPSIQAGQFVSAEKGVASGDQALAGARDIVAEAVSEQAEVRAHVRKQFREHALLCSKAVPAKTTEVTRFEQYYDFREALRDVPSHRFLAMRRGEQEGVLQLKLSVDADLILPGILKRMGWRRHSAFARQLELAVEDGYRRLLSSSIESELRVELKLKSDQDAVSVFASNLEDLLLAAPLGAKRVIGIDPGLRTGCKCVALDETGKFLAHRTIYPVRDEVSAKAGLAAFIQRHQPQAIAIGNGTASRETEALVRDLCNEAGIANVAAVVVNEAGASIYSASAVARDEFPDLDLTVRGAISIARRLQDPLAELVKIDPKSIGVGQYQHDVHQPLLARKLDEVVESCVNRVGVELNTASAPLLSRVAGIGPRLAERLVKHRDQHGAFANRKHMLKVSGLGQKTFEQCAGFLRIRGSSHPLDESAVHPERYALVELMAEDLRVDLQSLVGDEDAAGRIDLQRYVSDEVGEPTLEDIVAELRKPGRGPRETFEPPAFRDDVRELSDLSSGMMLEGVVTNVTHFGAFVDVGVHQDGLVHVSELADKFVKDPHDVVRVGQKLKVRVVDVDLERKRIALSARQEPRAKKSSSQPANKRRPNPKSDKPGRRDQSPGGGRNNPLGDFFRKLEQ